MKERESLGSRLGFLLLSAGCAIGIGNVWRFPYITGQCGGGLFVLIYLLFLCILGIPIITMEYAIGRASKKSILPAFKALEPSNSKWHLIGYLAMAGNYILLMFYSVVSGWFLYYFVLMLKGEFSGLDSAGIETIYKNMMSSPKILIIAMLCIMVLTVIICSAGLEKSVETITKYMMIALILIMVVLGIRSLTLPGASEGISFYLKPSLSNIKEAGLGTIIYKALNQSFFTLSIGMGSMLIFGSYIGKERSLLGEASIVAGLDTLVAFVSGLIIFPACFAYGIAPDSGPNLIFLTIPRVFSSMPGGRIWGSLFFLFLTFAALSTMIGVFENDISFAIDIFKISRKKAALINGIVISIGSIPCALGFNLWQNAHLFKQGKCIMDIEDFFVSNICLPVGSLVIILFCTSKRGWGFEKYLEEVNTGKGVKMAKWISFYYRFILPLIVGFLAIYGIADYFMH
ncbi:MAG: sodium-dependent transporter [Eubacterium sp.]|nr:sodium-dependent transporter [Eubacterium sp.]